VENKKIAIIMLGPPGAGKGTQARMMGAALELAHISTGDILREAVKNETELGKKAKQYMESGTLVPDEVVDQVILDRTKEKDCSLGFILDGYPRTIPQAENLGASFKNEGIEILTLGIQVRDEVLLDRLSSRWTCTQCSKTFNESLSPHSVNGICDACGGNLIQRKDDAVAVILERLRVYRDMTKPLIQYYCDQGRYVEVNGEKSVVDIYSAILGIIDERMNLRREARR
jgi:adenylate kinase